MDASFPRDEENAGRDRRRHGQLPKRQRRAVHDRGGNLQRTSGSGGPPPRHGHPGWQQHEPQPDLLAGYFPPWYQEELSTRSRNRKISGKTQRPSQTTALPGSSPPRGTVAGYLPRGIQQKGTGPRRVSRQEIKENPASSWRLPNVSLCKSKSDAGSANSEPDQIQDNVVGFSSTSLGLLTAHHLPCDKKVRKIVIKDIMGENDSKDEQISSSIVLETREDSIDANADPDRTGVIESEHPGKEENRNVVSAIESAEVFDTSGSKHLGKEFDVAGGTEGSHMEDLLDNNSASLERDAPLDVKDIKFFNLLSSRNLDCTKGPPLDNYHVEGSTMQVAELMHLHRASLSPENYFTLVHSQRSSSVSGNNEQIGPKAFTVDSNIYLSNAHREVQPKENYELVEGQQGLDVPLVTEFGSLGKRKRVTDDIFINAVVQSWLTLPPAVNNIAVSGQLLNNDGFVRKDRHLSHNLDNDAFVSQDHDTIPDMDQCESVDAFCRQDHIITLRGSDMPQSDLLAPEEIIGDAEDYSGIGISDHTYSSNTQDPLADSSTKQNLLSSWTESTLSEGKEEHQCKSTVRSVTLPDKLLAPPPKEDRQKLVLDSEVKTQINSTSSMFPKVAPQLVNLPSLSQKPICFSHNAMHRTWHSDSMASSTSSLHALQPSGLPPKQLLRKNSDTQNSYIRKGYSLIRNPATEIHPLSSPSLHNQSMLNKPVMRSMKFVREVDSNDFAARSDISVERHNTTPFLFHAKSINHTMNLSEQLSQTLQKWHVLDTEKEDSVGLLNLGVNNPSIRSARKSEPSDASKVVYVRPKSNQLIAAQRQCPGHFINSSLDKVLSLHPPSTSDLYLRKRKNRIVLSSSHSDSQNTEDMTHESLNLGGNKGLVIASNNNISGVKDKSHKGHQPRKNTRSFSHVWTLRGQQPQTKGFTETSYMKAYAHVLPWKIKLYYKNFSSHTQNTSSSPIVKKSLETKKRNIIYTVSRNGFSIRKSAVLSVDGSCLKWSRSLEECSQKVNKETAAAVADVERKKREKQQHQFLPDRSRNDQYSASIAGNQLRSNQVSDLRRSSTCNEYVHVNNGNQVIRNPKKVVRMLASDKVRWGLHTVRSRLAKKQPYCQFFTWFGECQKSVGKCPYIHDPSKVTICKKYLKGICSDASCKLTHKVLPESMQDCSYFLRGLCTNMACPYRHVKTNSSAPVCEDFLKGYCAVGDECHKKHSYVCPTFEATGECPQKSICKLHHPKKKVVSKTSRPGIHPNSSWRRYFGTSLCHDRETGNVSSNEEEGQRPQNVFSGGDFVDFMTLDADANVDVAAVDASDDVQMMGLNSGYFSSQADDLHALINPVRALRTARV